ncbi:MAG: adenosylcobinamide-GDP ribazoletransferase [Lachnospiraceae bacterium]|jgi:adenosylcobinamide-GDP ribazoletransferase|nr:adenosylcobinamide-GDP ribazoletransferase [Lachnospiraceae bacterium]MDD3615957.1 adenosylcobinamide-GDP ribazoletransferase [Lachnospiraceae bacterium]
MKKWINSFKISFSMYSKIPMPQSEWTKENMRYVMCFFPCIGVVIGALIQLWLLTAQKLPLANGSQSLLSAIVLLLIPVLVTGGIHLDGFLDTQDAMSSYQERERRLEILKDPRAGAFAIISGIVYFLIYLGINSELIAIDGSEGSKIWWIISISFIMTRAFSGLAIVTFKLAKNTGLAAAFSDGAQKNVVKIWMIVYIVLAAAVCLWISPVYGAACVITALAVFWYYRHLSYKNFGGITGDLAGWYVQVCECCIAGVLLVVWMILS